MLSEPDFKKRPPSPHRKLWWFRGVESDICRHRHLKFPPHGFPPFYDTLRIQLMEVRMIKEIKLGNRWISFGYSFRRFAVGFTIDRYHMDIDLVFFWVGIEF